MHKLILKSQQIKDRACHIINQAGYEKPLEVVIREHKADRSAAQNALYFKWITIIGSDLGETKDELHERYKGLFLVRIFERDDPEYAEMIAALRRLYKEDKEQGSFLFKQIVKLTSTTKANVSQFSEYLSDIEADARRLNIFLPHPDDYSLAMGRAA